MRMTGGVTNYYVYGQGLLYEVDETATTTTVLYYHPDARGSTVALTDASGNLTDQFEYSPYGTTTYHFGTNTTPFLYNGQFGVQTDPNGLLYMRARYYNPYICRFINADPSGFGGGLNFYAFANGNPISETDPFGLGAQGDSGGYSWIGQVSAIPSGILPSGPYSYLTGSGIVSDATATVANFGSLLGNTGSQFLNAFTTTAGAAVQGIDAVGEQFGAHDISTPVAIFFGGGIVGDLSAAGELAAEETTAGSTFYHYTTNPNLAGQGLNVGSGVTSVGDLNASEAMFQLGIDPPTHVYPVTLQNPLGYISINTGAPIRNGIPIWSVEVPTPAGSVGLPTLVPRAP